MFEYNTRMTKPKPGAANEQDATPPPKPKNSAEEDDVDWLTITTKRGAKREGDAGDEHRGR